jgi:hypothetical protein
MNDDDKQDLALAINAVAMAVQCLIKAIQGTLQERGEAILEAEKCAFAALVTASRLANLG